MFAETDVAIVGAGAAGLATAIFTRRLGASLAVTLMDGARRPGAKILVSGGGRCNVTNARVSETDFHGGSRAAIRLVLRSFQVSRTIEFFGGLGVPLHEEERGKLFPNSNRARSVLEALLGEAARAGVDRLDACRVTSIDRGGGAFVIDTSLGRVRARRVVLATGGRSLPKSGSDGAGYEFARALGHSIVAPVPALVPLLLDPSSAMNFASLSGASHDVELTVWIDGSALSRVHGPLLWTHFGISGPAALDASRHWTRATADCRQPRLTMSVRAGMSFAAVDEDVRARAAARPRLTLQSTVGEWVPAAVASALVRAINLEPVSTLGSLSRGSRRDLTRALVEWPLPVTGTRGYNYAEVTAGGVALGEISPKTMESRVAPGLFLVGEILDVDGRLGGFNFQWAWASAWSAARALTTWCPL
jgi:predicted Rossmann fold flavoprotein